MPNINNCTFMGHATRDTELAYTSNDKAYAKNGMAIVSGWGDKKHTSFIQVVCFGTPAEWAAKNIKKGSLYIVFGELEIKEYEGKNYITLIAKEMKFIKDPKKKNTDLQEQKASYSREEQQFRQQQPQQTEKEYHEYDDIPF